MEKLENMLGGSAKNEKNLGGFPCIRVCPFKAINSWLTSEIVKSQMGLVRLQFWINPYVSMLILA